MLAANRSALPLAHREYRRRARDTATVSSRTPPRLTETPAHTHEVLRARIALLDDVEDVVD
jgi:hypothetical protein